MSKSFKGDLVEILNNLKEKTPLAITRYGDGEMSIFQNRAIDLTKKHTGEYKFNPDDVDDSEYRNLLIESFQFHHPAHKAGIGCPCCVGNENFTWMKNFSQKPDDELTWANIFVNGNYPYFQSEFIQREFNKHKIVLICNHHANTSGLPFNIFQRFNVGVNAWKNDFGLIDKIKEWMPNEQLLFLIAAGPFANILVHQLCLHKEDNVYLNIGSTLDPYIRLGRTRGYLKGFKRTLNKICVWDEML